MPPLHRQWHNGKNHMMEGTENSVSPTLVDLGFRIIVANRGQRSWFDAFNIASFTSIFQLDFPGIREIPGDKLVSCAKMKDQMP